MTTHEFKGVQFSTESLEKLKALQANNNQQLRKDIFWIDAILADLETMKKITSNQTQLDINKVVTGQLTGFKDFLQQLKAPEK